MSPVTSYSPYLQDPVGSTGTGLDQVLGWIASDPGLAGANEGSAIATGIAASDALKSLLVEGLRATGALSKAVLSVADIQALNAWFRDPAAPQRLKAFLAAHGNDENGIETGYHAIQNDGGNRSFDGRSFIDTVLDSVYHIGFPLNADGTRLTNEDGADNALLVDVARWLTALKVDLATTGTDLDRIVERVVGDADLQAAIPWTDIQGGATAANSLNQLILEGIDALNAQGQADADPTRLGATEVRWLNSWIRSDASRYAHFVALHGDDENGSETGYHLVQNDGATTPLFGLNAVDTIYDGIYHIGFTINSDGRFQNEDGNANALVSDVAEWITYYLGDPSTSGSGLDRMIDWIRLDPGLSRWTSARDINDGLAAADALNHLLLKAIQATGVNLDGWISRHDLRLINRLVRESAYEEFNTNHGDDADGVETGFHLIQNDGATTQFFGQNLVNTVVDGIYHYGYEIRGDNFLNEDGNTNQTLGDVSGWLNAFLSDRRLTLGTEASDTLLGDGSEDQLLGRGGNDVIEAGDGGDLLDGGWGNDTLRGGAGADLLDGGFENDLLDGGEGSDTYLASGADPIYTETNWQIWSFQGYDTYADSGLGGIDQILAEGFGAVDIGLLSFGPSSGIEQIVNATEGGAMVRLLGNWQNNSLDFSGTELVGGPFQIDAGDGNDSVVGSSGADDIRGGRDNDGLDGAGGGDTYRVSGANPYWVAGMPYLFEGYDTYRDSGAATDGTDRIVAEGVGAVDIGFPSFDAGCGIEEIVNATVGEIQAVLLLPVEAAALAVEPSPGVAEVRLLGNWKDNRLDFSTTSLIGGGFLIDGAEGNDTIFGSVLADRLRGGHDNDWLDGGDGADLYEVTGNTPEWVEGQPYTFEGYDLYADSGSSGLDAILATGELPVDIGLLQFGPDSGIEWIVNATLAFDADGNASPAQVRLLGNWQANSLDFSATTLAGPFLIDGADGEDTIKGSAGNDRIRGGRDNDKLDGGGGSDIYEVSGQNPYNPDWTTYDFEGFDTFFDWGGRTDGVDSIQAVGWGAVDVGFLRIDGYFSGIEQIINATTVDDGNGGVTTAAVNLTGNWQANWLDFSSITLIGDKMRIVGGEGNDTIIGTAQDNRIWGGRDDDLLQGEAGNDTYEVRGRDPAHPDWRTYSFEGYDTYNDTNGYDRIVAIADNGSDGVDIGLRSFGPGSGIELIDASGTTGAVKLLGDWQANSLDFSATELRGANVSIELGDGSDSCVGSAQANLVRGGFGNDQIRTLAGDDTIYGEGGNDSLDGGEGSDTYFVSGLESGGWQSYGGQDTYTDSGLIGLDRIVAFGNSDVDIGLAGGNFLATAGIEQIVNSTSKLVGGVSVAGQVRLQGNGSANTLQFAGMRFLGGGFVIDAGDGNDTIGGSVDAERILAGRGDDTVDGGGGADIYEVGGSLAAGSFQGFDTITDRGTGAGVIDRLVAASGTAAVDIGLKSFSTANGIEVIDATATTGSVRLLGDATANVLNFTGISLLGANLSIDSGDGNDTVTGGSSADRLRGGKGDDILSGAGGSDTYEVAGSLAAGSFEGYDTITDRGTGAGEIDRLVAAAGTAAVDIGLKSFSTANGIEVIDATATTGAVRLLGDATANVLNFSGSTLLGANLRIESGDGNDTITGSRGADTILAGVGVDKVIGGDGDDTISGGGGLDNLTGGLGVNSFVYTLLTDGIVGGTTAARTFERIVDFTVGRDRFDVSTAPAAGAFRNLGALSGLTNAALTTLLSPTNFGSSGAATFTYGSGTSLRTFIAFNDGSAGFNAITDAVVEITGYRFATGFSSLSEISIV
jgi:Ca2+-binding RTX toxin-like protein